LTSKEQSVFNSSAVDEQKNVTEELKREENQCEESEDPNHQRSVTFWTA
jgi:hypothetical protein